MTARQVGTYRLDSLLGAGAMGEVYQAYDSDRDRYVALKLLPEFFSGDHEYLMRFQRESLVAARLREPHVIPIHDFGEVDGRLFIDMHLADGIDIRRLLDSDGPIAPQRAVNLLSQVAQALDAAHADGLVHRDIKPSNILVTARDFVYVVDFGIARPMGGRQTSLTTTGAAIGTLDYMAPERFAGQAIDGRADVYSLACVLHECLTATPPFPGNDLASLRYAHLNSSPPQASSLVEGVPPALDAVIARGMAKDPADRFSSAGALAAAAQEALLLGALSPASRLQAGIADMHEALNRPARARRPADGFPTVGAAYVPAQSPRLNGTDDPGGVLLPENSPRGAHSGSRASRPPRNAATARPTHESAWRRRGMLVLTGAVAIGIVTALITHFTGHEPGSLPKTNAAAVGSAPRSASAPAKVPASTPASAPASVADPAVAASVAVEGTPSDIQIAPNGRFAYITSQNPDMVTVLDTATDRTSKTIRISQGPPQFVSFSPGGQTAYVSVYSDGGSVNPLVAFIDTATGTVTSTVPVNNDSPGPSTVSPDGRYLYVPNHNMTMGVPNGQIIDVIDTAQKRVVDNITVPMNPHWIVFGAGGRYLYVSDHMSGVVTVLNPHTNSIVKEIPVGLTPHGEAISPDGSILAVTSYNGNFVTFVNTTTDMVTAKVKVGDSPQACSYAPDGRHLYVVNNVSNTVTVIDTTDYRVTGTIRVGKDPTSIAVLPSGRRAYVTNENSSSVDVLNIAG
jgi:YVTN family beta-propeller protein